jgi:hypothetical protein
MMMRDTSALLDNLISDFFFHIFCDLYEIFEGNLLSVVEIEGIVEVDTCTSFVDLCDSERKDDSTSIESSLGSSLKAS